MAYQDSFDIHSRGRGTTEITAQVERIARAAAVATGIAHVFVLHTSCSLVLTENADPSVRRDPGNPGCTLGARRRSGVPARLRG